MQNVAWKVLPHARNSFQSILKPPTGCLQTYNSIRYGGTTYCRLNASRKQLLSNRLKWMLTTTRQAVRQTATSASSAKISPRGQKIVGTWLLGCAGLVAGTLVLGGVTRLTESGLSMVDWKLLKDMKPPSSQQEWEEEFERYKQFPEYKHNARQREVTLSDFKFIFYFEYFHRMAGRTVGLAFVLPAMYFLKKGWISKALKPRLAVYAALIGFQGFLGWYMVKSGLKEETLTRDVPSVSQYRLAAHLGSALLLYALFFWQGLSHVMKPIQMGDMKGLSRLRGMAHPMLGLVFLTALSGAFVAGLDAGLIYNTWPKMADRWIPTDLWSVTPKWRNVFDNPTMVQFNHRNLAETTMCLIGVYWYMSRKVKLPGRAKLAINSMFAIALLQGTIGIFTLLNYVPVWLGATHQGGSVALLSMAVWVAHELRRLPKCLVAPHEDGSSK